LHSPEQASGKGNEEDEEIDERRHFKIEGNTG